MIDLPISCIIPAVYARLASVSFSAKQDMCFAAMAVFMLWLQNASPSHSYPSRGLSNNLDAPQDSRAILSITLSPRYETARSIEVVLEVKEYAAEFIKASTFVDSTESFSTTDEPDITASWEGPDTDTKYPRGIIFEKCPGDETDKLRYQICEMEIEITSGAAGNIDIEIQSVWTELIHDDTTPGFDVEFLKRSAATRLYGPDYFISAWHVMNVLCEAHLRMQYEGRCRYTLPFCGQGVEPYA